MAGGSAFSLRFPELRGGPVQGLNDAGVENFLGAIDTYVSRECGQNTGDAKRDDECFARLEFDLLEIPAHELPGITELREALDSCMTRWGARDKEKTFFQQAIDMARRSTIPVLKISDFGTTGLTGSDEIGRWFALVKSQGVSEKGDGAGGSFGIGKSSPFAASRLRTVFYGSKTEDGEVALQGVSRLATHSDRNGQSTQGVGFIGTYDASGGEGGDPVFRAVRKEADIPAIFRRTEVGTDIWVIGYSSGSKWHDDLIRSIVNNFWPAIHQGIIKFRVGKQRIESDNLEELIRKHRGAEDFEADHFYPAVRCQPIRATLKHVGECELYLSTATPDLPRRICMARQSGMKIYDYQPRACRVPFSGLFLCKDPRGNPLLRQMEPPRHDTWDPKRIESSIGRRALDEIKAWIRDEVKKLNPLHSGSSFDETELAKYIPDEEPADLPSENNGDSNEESLEARPRPEEPPVKPIEPRVVPVVIRAAEEGGAGEEKEDSSDQRRGAAQGNGRGAGDAAKGDSSSRPSRLQVRSYRLPGNIYRLVLRGPSEYSGRVAICALGEDGAKDFVPIKKAWLEPLNGGGVVELPIGGGAIQNLHIPTGEAVHISIELGTADRLALTAVALA